jgi:Tol biopolymer transport system component
VVARDGSARGSWSRGWGLIEVVDWSPDGRDILAATFYPDKHEWTLVSVADGSARPLRTFTATTALDGRFSPDGLYVAYSRTTGKGGNSPRTRDVFLLSLETSREIPIVENLADDALLEWLRDGRGILFASDRAGTIDMWTIQIENGQPKGGPTLVRRSIGPITPLGLTKAGAFYYRTPSSFMDVYTASLDPKTGNVTGPLKKEPLPWEGHNRWSDWSPDGKRLAYVSTRPTVVGPFQPGTAREFIVCVYSADTGSVREYRLEKVFLGPHWSPDGRQLYVAASNMDGRGIYRLDVESGEFTPFLFAGENLGVRYFQVSADGNWIVYNRNNTILLRDAGTGGEKELDRASLSPAALALSRDGSRLAVMRVDKTTKALKAMQFPDGTPKEIQRLREKEGASEVALSSDGRFIYYSDVAPDGGSAWRLWRVPADGGTPQDTGLVVPNYFEQLTVHPDGLRLTFDTPTINPERSQVWVMENFHAGAEIGVGRMARPQTASIVDGGLGAMLYVTETTPGTPLRISAARRSRVSNGSRVGVATRASTLSQQRTSICWPNSRRLSRIPVTRS